MQDKIKIISISPDEFLYKTVYTQTSDLSDSTYLFTTWLICLLFVAVL